MTDENIVEVITETNKKYLLNKKTFAALSYDDDNPLSCTSLANSSFSIDLWKGCQYRCAYCHVQGCLNDHLNGTIFYKPIRRGTFTEREVVETLINYPLFKKNRSIISVNTSSTEPFANEEVTDSTIQVIESFSSLGYQNPIWIVTKGGKISENQLLRLKKEIKKGARIIVSICWTNNIIEIEPMNHNRFSFVKKLNDIGVHVNWYMRPLVSEWNSSKENIDYIMKYVSDNKFPIKSIVAGGLRWTSGIEYGLVEINKLNLPNLVKNENTKTLSNEIIERIQNAHKKYLADKPLFFKSGCSLSYALNIPNTNLGGLLDESDCYLSVCDEKQKIKCRSHEIKNLELINEEIKEHGYKLDLKNEQWRLISIKDKNTYQESVNVKKHLQDLIYGNV